MVAHASELQLRPEQVERVKGIAKQLEATNAPLEQSLAKLEPKGGSDTGNTEAPPPGRRGGGMGRGGGGAFRGGGRGGMGMGGGMGGMGRGMGGGMGGASRGRGGPSGEGTQAPSHAHTDQAQTVRAQMAENHAAAVAKAFSVLDDTQQVRASKLLDDNDFDPPSVESVRAAHDGESKHATGP
jgi:hypothetical protein